MRQELCVIRRMQQDDLVAAAEIHKAVFVRQRNSYHWLACNLVAYPRIMAYVATHNDQCMGYCLWTQKSGFRPEVVLELEQIAVGPECQGEGIAKHLITESLADVRSVLARHGSMLKHILLTTGADVQAQRLYASVLGAKVEALIPHLYAQDEVIMIARNVEPLSRPEQAPRDPGPRTTDVRDPTGTVLEP